VRVRVTVRVKVRVRGEHTQQRRVPARRQCAEEQVGRHPARHLVRVRVRARARARARARGRARARARARVSLEGGRHLRVASTPSPDPGLITTRCGTEASIGVSSGSEESVARRAGPALICAMCCSACRPLGPQSTR
jgi:hypothetical protein